MDAALIPDWLAELIAGLQPWQARLLAVWIEPLAEVVEFILSEAEEGPDDVAA